MQTPIILIQHVQLTACFLRTLIVDDMSLIGGDNSTRRRLAVSAAAALHYSGRGVADLPSRLVANRLGGRTGGRASQPAVLPHVCDFECLSRSKSGDATRHDATTSACPIDRRRFNFLFDAGEPLRRSRVIILLPHTADCSVSHFRAANVSLLSSSVALTAVDLISLLNLFYVLSALVIQIHF